MRFKFLRKYKKNEIMESLTGYCFLTPALIFFIIFMVYPFFQSLLLSFFKWDGIGAWEFNGVKNYIEMFTKDRYIFIALRNTIIYSFSATFGTVVVGFILAIFIDSKIKFWRIYRIIFFLTYILSVIAVGLLWTKIFALDGLLNSLLGVINLQKLQIAWLNNPIRSVLLMAFIGVWQYSSFPMVLFLAGMQNINEEIYEAARIDGASKLRTIFSITIPVLKDLFSIVIILQLIFSFKVFDIVYIMTGGGPASQTEVLGTLIYRYAFKQFKFGFASVLSVIMILLAIVYSFLYSRVSRYHSEIKD